MEASSIMGAWDGDWRNTFAPRTLIHLVTVAVCAGAMIAACHRGRCWHPGERDARFRVTWGWAVLLFQIGYVIWYAQPSRWDWKESLPLQLCDVAVFVAVLAMITQWRPWRTLLYFWGIGLSTQAFLTPTVDVGVMHTRFWLFWVGHTAIVGSAVYDIIVRGYRPKLRDLGVALLTTYTLGMTLFYFDVLMTNLLGESVNYWYIGPSKPGSPTIIDSLGPWPLRVMWVAAIVVTDFVVLWALWPLMRKLTGGRDPVAAATGGCD